MSRVNSWVKSQTISWINSQVKCKTKSQLILEWIYEVIVSSKILTKNCQNFCPHYTGQKSWQFFVGILGEMMTSWIHSEINWPLMFKFCHFDRSSSIEIDVEYLIWFSFHLLKNEENFFFQHYKKTTEKIIRNIT